MKWKCKKCEKESDGLTAQVKVSAQKRQVVWPEKVVCRKCAGCMGTD